MLQKTKRHWPSTVIQIFLLTSLFLNSASVATFPASAAEHPTSALAVTTYLNEQFQDHANNWNWQRWDAAAGVETSTGPSWLENGRFSNCTPNNCAPFGATRAWLGVATNASAYTIEADLHLITAEECKLLYTNANRDEAWRIDLMRTANQVRLLPGGATWSPSQSGGRHGPITANASYHLKVDVQRNKIDVYYRKGSEPFDRVLSVTTGIYPDGKVGVGTFNGDCDFDNFTVTGEEGTGAGVSRLMPIFSYERTEACDEGPHNLYKDNGSEQLSEIECDRPLFAPWNRDRQAWWNAMVEEMDHANLGTIAVHNRGCYDETSTQMHGKGDLCPNQLKRLVNALQARNSGMKVAMFDDFQTVGALYQWGTADEINHGLPVPYWQDFQQPFDFNDPDPNRSRWSKYLWTTRWQLFFDTVPSQYLARENDRPLIFIWSPNNEGVFNFFFSNPNGNVSRMLDWLRQKVQATYGFNPFIVVDQNLYTKDPTLNGHVDALFTWFDANTQFGAGTLPPARYNTYTGATIAPGFRSGHHSPGCGTSCLEIHRQHGHELIANLETHKSTKFVLLESWTNVIESAGYYRSLEGNDPRNCTQAGGDKQNAWDYPNQTLNILQRYANPNRDPLTTYMEFEAETADEYKDNTPGNIGGAYRAAPANSTCIYNDLDIGYAGSGYAVGWVEPGEWIKFRDIYLPNGTYALNVRYATPNADAEVCVLVNRAVKVNNMATFCSGSLPKTGDAWGTTTWQTASLGTFQVHRGLSNLKFIFPRGALNLDKIMLSGVGLGTATLEDALPAELSTDDPAVEVETVESEP